MSLKKFTQIIPIGKQEFAYQCENVNTVCSITGRVPTSGGVQPYPNGEKDQFDKYDLRIIKFTSNALTVELVKYYSHENQMQHRKKGELIRSITYQATMSFAQLVNQIFNGVELAEYEEVTGIPKSVAEELIKATNQNSSQ